MHDGGLCLRLCTRGSSDIDARSTNLDADTGRDIISNAANAYPPAANGDGHSGLGHAVAVSRSRDGDIYHPVADPDAEKPRLGPAHRARA